MSTSLKHVFSNFTVANDIVENVENTLKKAATQLEQEGRQSLEKARKRNEQFGTQSAKMTEYAREARQTADQHEAEAQDFINQLNGALNTSNTAFNLAKEAINTQKNSKEDLKNLKERLDGVKTQYHLVQKLTENVHKDAIRAEDESLALLTEVSDNKVSFPLGEYLVFLSNLFINFPPPIQVLDVNTTGYLATAKSIMNQASQAKREAEKIIEEHEKLINSTGNRLKDARELFEAASKKQKHADLLLSDVNRAFNDTQTAQRNADAILEEAKKTLKTLKEFDQNIQNSKQAASESTSQVDQIQTDLLELFDRNAQIKQNLSVWLQEAGQSNVTAMAAQARADQAREEAKLVRNSTESIAIQLEQLRTELAGLSSIQELADQLTAYENKATDDEKLVQDALQLANTAQAEVQETIGQLENRTTVVDDILKQLSKFLSCFSKLNPYPFPPLLHHQAA